MAAVMRVLESWLYFQKGNPQQAIAILQEAEATLLETDDYLTLGTSSLLTGASPGVRALSTRHRPFQRGHRRVQETRSPASQRGPLTY